MSGLRQALCLAQTMGEKLGNGEILQRTLPAQQIGYSPCPLTYF